MNNYYTKEIIKEITIITIAVIIGLLFVRGTKQTEFSIKTKEPNTIIVSGNDTTYIYKID